MNYLKKGNFWSPEENTNLVTIEEDEQKKSKEETILSGGPKDDSPSFAPNGNWLIFSSRISGKEILSAVSVDGKVKTRITMESGDIRSPAWGKLPQ